MPNKQPNLLCLCGSLRPTSYSLATCRTVQGIGEAEGVGVEIMDPREHDLPMYVPDIEIEHYAPRHGEGIRWLIEAYRRADAMVWVSPTYHGTISGVFKNTLDFAEFLCRDSRPYLQGRAVGLISINDSTPLAAMRDCARELRAWVCPTQIALSGKDFDDELRMSSERSLGRIARLVGELASFARLQNP
jgi:FMN reductase